MTVSTSETITVDELRRLARSRGRLRLKARDALRRAEWLEREGALASIRLDRQLRLIQVFSDGGLSVPAAFS